MRGQQLLTIVDETIETFEVENSKPLMDWNPRPLDGMPSALFAELWECDPFKFMFWDDGSGDLDIFVCRIYLCLIIYVERTGVNGFYYVIFVQNSNEICLAR